MKSFLTNHPFEIWESGPNQAPTYAGTRFSNLQTAALTVVIRKRLAATSDVDRFVVHRLYLTYTDCPRWDLYQCRELLQTGEQITAYIPDKRQDKLNSLPTHSGVRVLDYYA